MNDKPRLLDLFSGAGGAAKGYQCAGFHVTGVDIEQQPRYCGDEFHQADAMTFPLEGFDCIHASPPCQSYSQTQWLPHRDMSNYPQLIEPLRERLIAANVPYAIENVVGAPLLNPLMLCGTMFGLRVIRHRLFEVEPTIWFPPATCSHKGRTKAQGSGAGVYNSGQHYHVTVAGHVYQLALGCEAMGIDWMTRDELAEAIPPAYTTFIGGFLMAELARLQESPR